MDKDEILKTMESILNSNAERIEELEESNMKWQRTCEAKSDTNSQLTEQLADKVEKIAELEKENAELKEKVNILDNCDRLGDVITEAYKDQLTKAKEIIKGLLELGSIGDGDYTYVAQAEQFLKDSEVEK